jgi:hypothetical protein
MATVAGVPDQAMPQLFQAADQASLDAQASYVGRTRLRLLLLCAAAAAGVMTWRAGDAGVEVGAVAALCLFTLAFFVEALMWRDRPDKVWYDGRAVAESAKTLAWKFAVGGDPFPVAMPPNQATRLLLGRLDAVSTQFKDLELAPVDAPVISAWMNQTRSGGFTARKATYLEQRVADQRQWYDARSRYNRRRSRQWRTGLMSIEATGMLTALVAAVTPIDFVFGPVLAALAGAAVAWVETKQHDSLSRAYAAAVRDLSGVQARLGLVDSETEWAREVADAEEAISREHTVWMASRSRA